jgi:hypothetical protein
MDMVNVPLLYSIFNERNCLKLNLNQFTFLKNFWTDFGQGFSYEGLK